MAINESIFGTSKAWDSNPTYSFLKMADFGENQNSLLNGVTLGKLSPDTPLDNSIAFCGVGTECPLSNVQILTNDSNGAVFESTIKRDVSNWCLYTTTERWVLYGDPNRIADEHSDWSNVVTDTDNINRYLKPITDFNIKNLVGVIYVRCYTLTEVGGFTVSLKEYLDQYVNSHPLISEVYLLLYGSEVISTTGRDPLYAISGIYGGISVSTLDSFPVGDDDLYRYASYNGSSRFNYLPIYGSYDFDMYSGEKWLIYGSQDLFEINRNDDYLRCYIHVTNAADFKELCLKGAAQYGLYFTDDEDIARTGSFTDKNMYIGVLDKNSITHGEYLKGTDTLRAKQNEWESIRDSEYDPKVQIIDYDTTSHYGSLSYHNFNRMYSLTDEQVSQLNRIMSAAMGAKPTDMSATDYSTDTFLTNNPIDCIVSLRKYPIVDTSASTSALPVKFGGYTSDINAPYAATGVTIRYDFTGNKSFISKYGNSFLDRAPYTTAELFVPFCGNIKLDTDTYIDHAIGVKLVVDYLTGSCTAYIERDGIPLETINGTIGLDVPVTGVQTQTLTNTIMRNVANSHAAQVSAVQSARGGANIVSVGNFKEGGNVLSPVTALAGTTERTYTAMESADIAEYQLYHTEIPFKSVSAGSAFTAGSGEWVCRLSITRPVLSSDYGPEIYGRTVGFACLINGKVSDFTGLTVGTINLSGVNCSDREKELIAAAFKHGVII